MRGSKKVKKGSVSAPQTRSRNNSYDSDLGVLSSPNKTRGGDMDNGRIRKLLKAVEGEEVFVENWLQCDKCGKWRKITDGKVKFLYHRILNINGFDRNLVEEAAK